MSAPLGELVLLALAAHFWWRLLHRWASGEAAPLLGALLETVGVSVLFLLAVGTVGVATGLLGWALGGG